LKRRHAPPQTAETRAGACIFGCLGRCPGRDYARSAPLLSAARARIPGAAAADNRAVDLATLLVPDASDRGGYWATEDDVPGSRRWDELAAEDPVHAAISARSEAREAAKSESQIDLLERELIDGVVLDAGCGYGRIAKYLLPRRSFDGYVGVDGSTTMLGAFARRHRQVPEEAATPLLLVRAPIDRIPIRPASVQNVVFSAVLLHNPKDAARSAIAEAARLLAPGGRLLIVGGDLRNARTSAGAVGAVYLGWLRLRRDADRNGPIRYWKRRELTALFPDFTEVWIRPTGFDFLPKGMPGAPRRVDRIYRRGVHDPAQWVADRTIPGVWKRRLCDRWLVRAVK